MKLNKLDHLLLSMLCNGREPLHALYSDTTKRLKKVQANDLVNALANVVKIGYASCYFYNDMEQRYEPCGEVNAANLREHVSTRAPAELSNWPDESFGGEYFFEITEKGITEEAKEMYAGYYAGAILEDG